MRIKLIYTHFNSLIYNNTDISFTMASIKEMDQNNWVCYKFGDSSYFYGEVGLLDQSGVVHPKDSTELAADPKVKLVKHGFGVYIYEDPTGACRYEGHWSKDHKNGKGTLKMKDGEYEGQFKDGFYHDNGVLKWANGDIYDGRWKKGRMEGPGVFKRHDGLSLKGSFKNNYFIDGNNLRNPFMSD